MTKVLSLLLNVMLLATSPTMYLLADPPANDPPVITVSGNTNICFGSSTTLTASGAQTYTWSTALAIDGLSSAKLAVGLHKLKTGYAGFALQLRRSSDDATMDFGFTGNELDLASINTFLNGANGFCTILYDQSGNGNNMTQPIAASQPLFVANGQNGKPVLHYSAGSQFMQNSTNFNTPYSVVYAAKQTGGASARVLSSVNNNWLLGWWGGSANVAYFEGWITAASIPADITPMIYACTGDGTKSSFYGNGSAIVSNSTQGLAGPNGIQMNGSGLFGEYSNCDFMDVMVFNSVLSGPERQLVENTTAAYYNIGNGGSQLTVSPSATTTYTITGTNANGESASTTVTVNVSPQHDISPAGPIMLCTGSSATLTASVGSSYLWSTGATTQSIVVDTAGAFSVSIDNCPAINFVQTYIASVTPSSTSICGGHAILQASGPIAQTNFNWTNQNDFDNVEVNVPLCTQVIGFTIGNTSAFGHSHTGAPVNIKIDLYNPISAEWVNILDQFTTSQFSFSGLTLSFPVIASVSKMRFTSSPAQNQSFHSFFNGVPITFTGIPAAFSYLWNTGSTNQIITVNTPGTYSVSIAGCSPVPVVVSPIPGDTSVFGNNKWNVYAWNAGEANDTTHSWNTNYSGYYTSDSLNFNTQDDWPTSGSPSNAPNYQGCPVNADNHSWSAKRHGFPCGYYQVDVPGHDDAGQLFIDGVKVWEHLGCCDSHENVWRGYLNTSSNVEFRVTEGGGDSYGSVSFIPVIELNCAANNNITVNLPPGQCSTTVTLTAPTATDVCSPVIITNDHPSDTFGSGTTYVTWTGTSVNGAIATCITVVNVLETTPPVINCPASVTVNSTPGLCGAVVNIAATATDNCPGSAVAINEFNYTGSVQKFLVPAGVSTIKITAIGAAGGDAPNNAVGGKGASMSGYFQVVPGDTLYMVVGQKGTSSVAYPNGGAGGGGTFISKDKLLINGLLIAAGGGGGAGTGPGSNANITTNGGNASGSYYGNISGGSNGNGGGGAAGGGGAGWLSDGGYSECYNNGGLTAAEGAAGGNCGAAAGGYGGGGGTYYGAGGGGGYSGGAGGDYSDGFGFGTPGGGGGSFNSGQNTANTVAVGTGNGKVIIQYTATFPIIALTSGIPSGNVFPIGTTLEVWTATDASGNTAVCSASVSVLDKEAPVLTCPANISTNVDAGQCTAIVNYNQPIVNDNCCPTLDGNPQYTYLGSLGTHTYYLSTGSTDWNTAHVAAVAAGGNLVSVNSPTENSFLTTALNGTGVWLGGFQNHLSPNYSEPAGGWEWVDGTPFTFTNWSANEPNNSGGEDYTQFYGNGTWNDLYANGYSRYVVEMSCNLQTVQLSGPVSGSAFPIGTTTITYKATDAAGNSSTCSFNITVTDNANPGVVVSPITGNANICIGTPSQLADATGGGAWSSDNTAVAIVSNTGLVSGVAPGSATIKYTVNINGCDRVVYKPVTVYSVPVLTNAIITGITNVCPFVGTGLPLTYTITNAISATGYTWTVPPTVTILSGQGTNSITVTINTGFVSGANKQIRVKGNSQCGSSTDKIFYLAAQLPNTPQPISGSTNICSVIGSPTAVSYKIAIVPGATSYIWTIPANTTATHPNGPGAFDTIINIIYTSAFTGGNISVQTVNDCGTSGLRTLTINRTAASMPGLISGPTNACPYTLPNGSVATYYISPVPNATSYAWTTPVNSVVTHPYTGANDTVITVKYPNGFTSGNISVTATNGCGTSTARTLAITRLTPATPSVIDVIQTQFCPGRSYSYTLSSMPANAVSVQWAVPAAALSFTGQGTTSITVYYPDAVAINGTVTATAINNCGASSVRSTTVKLPACATSFSKGGNESSSGSKQTAAENITSENKITVVPNPSTSSFKLTVNSMSKQTVQVTLLDASGRKIKTMNAQANQSIDFGSELRAGIYLLEIEQGGKRKTERIIKL